MRRKSLGYIFAVGIMNSVKKISSYSIFSKDLIKEGFYFFAPSEGNIYVEGNIYARDNGVLALVEKGGKTYTFEYDYIKKKGNFITYDVKTGNEEVRIFNSSPDIFKKNFLEFVKK